MKANSAALKAHYAQERTTRARCWKLTRKDATVYGFTDHVSDIVVSGVTYSASSGFTTSETDTRSAMNVDGMEVGVAFEAATITVDDMLAGLWDYSAIEMFEVNYEDLTQGQNNIRTGVLGEVRYTDTGFVAEVRGLMQYFQARFGRIYAPSCNADVGDTRCGINLGTFTDGTVTSTVTSVASMRQFTCAAVTQVTGWFDGGKVNFTGGANAGLSSEVKTQTSLGVIVLQLPMPYTIVAGDAFNVTAGCVKSFAVCVSKFANGSRFRGFPHVPGVDRLWSGT